MLTGDALLQGLLQRGFSRAQAAALVGNMKQESEFQPGVVNPGEGAQGLIQWRKDRLTNLQNFAAQNGQSYTDPNTQLDFIVHEMTGLEAKNARPFLQATDVGSANAALKRYIRYGDDSEPTRLKNATAYAGDSADSPALGAVNNLAEAQPPVPNNLVHSVNYVPPPNSGQQGNFAPLPAFQDTQQPAAAPSAPQAVQPPPAAPAAAPDPNADVLKQWGVDAGTAAPSQDAPAAPEQDILKAWGVDQNEPTPAGDIAKSQEAAPAKTFGQTVGGAIDTGLDAAGKVASPVFDMGNNLIRQVGTGVPVIGGALNKLDAATNAVIAPAINPFLSKETQLQGGTFGERYQNSLTMQNGQDQQFQADHPVLSTGAQIGGGIGALGGAASAVPVVGTALGMTGNFATRTGMGMLSGAALGGADAAVRSSGDPNAAIRGAEFGGALGAVTPAAGAVIGSAANKLLGGSVSTRVAQLAQLARDKYGINVGPGQLSTNPTIKFLDSVVNRLPLSGGTAAKEAQQTAFNSAVANSFGENAKAVTPEVIDAAKSRIGKVFDSVADRTPVINADGQFQTDILNAFKEAQQTLQPSEIDPLRNQMQAIVQKFKDGTGSKFVGLDDGWGMGKDAYTVNGQRQAAVKYGGETFVADSHQLAIKKAIDKYGPEAAQAIDGDPETHLGFLVSTPSAIDGATYQALTRKGAPLDRMMNSIDPNIRYTAGQIRDALDGTLERSAPADVLSDLQQARSQWKALKTVEPLATKSATGDISPALLMTQAAKQYGGASFGKGSDLVDLGRIGQQFLKEAPSSGTAERTPLVNSLLSGAGGAGAIGLALNPAMIPLVAGKAAVGAGLLRGAGALLRSPTIANKMIQNGLGQGGAGNMLLRAIPQGSLPTYQRQPLDLTVKPNRLQ